MYIFKYFSSILKLLSADTIETVQTVHVYITLQFLVTKLGKTYRGDQVQIIYLRNYFK